MNNFVFHLPNDRKLLIYIQFYVNVDSIVFIRSFIAQCQYSLAFKAVKIQIKYIYIKRKIQKH